MTAVIIDLNKEQFDQLIEWMVEEDLSLSDAINRCVEVALDDKNN